MRLIFFACLLAVALASPTQPKADKKGKAPWITLNDGNKMPSFGFGTSAGYGNKNTKAQKSIEDAISAGYRLFDTAESYGNEEEIGKAIKKKIRDHTITREDVFVATKLGNLHHAQHLVIPTLKESLKRLNLDYVDLYIVHWPLAEFSNFTFADTDYLETWKGMEEAKTLGLAKSIGISNFNEKQIERLIKNSKVKPAVLEIEVNPTLTQKQLTKFCEEKNIAVIAFAPLGSIPEAKKKKDAPPPTIDDPTLTKIAHKYKKSTVQVVLRYLVDRKIVPIPKSTTSSRIQENIDIYDFTLTPDEIKTIDAFNKDFRNIHVPEWKTHKYYPFV